MRLFGKKGNVRWRSLLRLRLRCPFCQAAPLRFAGQKGNVRWRSLLRLRLRCPACHANRLTALRAERRFSPALAGPENATAVAVSRNAYTPTGYRLLAVRFAKRIAIGSPGKMATD